MTSKSEWLRETKRLLELEWASETELAEKELDLAPRRVLEGLGLTVPFLVIDEVRTGLYGRTLITFTSSKHGRTLSSNATGVGDIVRVVPNGGVPKDGSMGFEAPSGIVSKVTETSIDVAFDDRTNDDVFHELRDMAPLRLDKLPNDSTHRKQMQVLDQLENLHTSSPAYHVSQVLFGEAEPLQHASLPTNGPIEPFNPGLNQPQLEAVDFALRSRDIALIHGPPGTGKSTTVIEIIRQAVEVMGMRVLVCAPSNVAVDNIILHLSKTMKSNKKKSSKNPIHMVRFGHPARLLPEVLSHSLDATVKRAEGTEIVNDIRNELQDILKQLNGPKGTSKSKKKNDKGKRNFKEMKTELKTLRKELRTYESDVVKNVAKRANVVLATNAGAPSILKALYGKSKNRLMNDDDVFDLVIIDEAAQAIEASCWIPILMGRRVVLAGDHCQLPPTIKCDQAARGLLGTTLFDRVVSMYGERVVRLLSIQYRMHQLISDWASNAMYEGKLLADESVAHRLLSDLPHVNAKAARVAHPDTEDSDISTLTTLLMIDTAYCGLEEAMEGDDDDDHNSSSSKTSSKLAVVNPNSVGSRYNQGEADIVKKHLKELFELGLKEPEVAVITPYNAQVHLLRSMLLEEYPSLEIRSVDGFQGREKEAVILSLVRSNPESNVGFLADDRRLNVAITRAKRHVCVICDTATISSGTGTFLDDMVKYFHDHALLLSAEMYVEGCTPIHQAPRIPKSAKKEKQPVQKNDNEERKAELKKTVEAFMADANISTFEFPPSLNSFERQVVHAIAEELGVKHQSHGEGKTRRIILEKQAFKEVSLQDELEAFAKEEEELLVALTEPENAELEKPNEELEEQEQQQEDENDEEGEGEELEQEQQEEEENEEEEEETPPPAPQMNAEMQEFAKTYIPKRYQELMAQGMTANDACAQAVKDLPGAFSTREENVSAAASRPKTELEKIREMHAQRYAAAKEKEKQVEQEKKSAKQQNKKKHNKNKKKSSINKPTPQVVGPYQAVAKTSDSLDEDAFLDSVIAAGRKCAFAECGDSVTTVGSNCGFCKLRFCYKHGQAEVHGCGQHARAQARKDFVGSTSTTASKPLKSHQKSYLKRELAKKLEDEQKKRSAKTSSKSKKKK